MSDEARPKSEGIPPSDENAEPESWLREAARTPSIAPLPLLGHVVGGKYRIEEQLGRGGMGVVFRARHLVSEKPVALKWMLRPTTDEQARRRFAREARAAGRVEHPNVVALYDVGEQGECSYLVMELLRGESLRSRLERGAIDPTEVIDMLIPAMRGVAAAHRAGVVHRDLKPDNIFLCQEREGSRRDAKVLDFGVSSIASKETADSTLTQEGALLGSLAYMSPEQLRSAHDVDARTDVYAFGVILYETLTGSLPFQGATHSALIVAIATTQPLRPSQVRASVPAGLEQVVLRALARDPSERYADIEELIDALLPFASAASHGGELRASLAHARTVAAAPSNAGARQHTPAPAQAADDRAPVARRPVSGARVALLAIAVLAAAALWAFTSQQPDPAASQSPIATSPAALAPASVPTPAAALVPALGPARAFASAPALAPTSAPAPAPTSAPAPAPALASAPALAPRHAQTHPKAKPQRTRPARAAKGSADVDEAALFSGRK